jgi:hypothetical protein
MMNFKTVIVKHIAGIILLFLFAGNRQQLRAQTSEVCYNPNLVKDTSKKSIKSMAVALVGNDSVKISYHSPGVRKRIIWGGLVPYDEVWVTGAHDATTIEIGKSFTVNGKEIPGGKYAIFTIPGRKEWTIIINKRWKQHLASEYDEKEDIVRVKVKPKKNAHTERLQYFIENTKENNGKIAVAWEKIRIEFPFTIKN